MMFPAPIYLLIQLAGLYGAFRIGTESIKFDDKSKKCKSEPFKGGFKGMWDRNPIDVALVIAFLLSSVVIAFTNMSTFSLGGFGGGGRYGGGGYGGGGYGGGGGYY